MRPVPVGTLSDTPHSLRRKAAEFARLAGQTGDAASRAELRELARRYTARAEELEREAAAPPGRAKAERDQH